MKEDVQEFVVRIPPRNQNKSYHVMKFNANMKVDVGKWTQVRMVRENNRKDPTAFGEQMPKFGAGSEFGREQREEARRRRFGAGPKKYDPDMQPWLMRVGNKKEGKHYKGAREGGVSENTTYYVFTHAQDGAFEAHPIKEWYNFTPRVMYKTLNSEEAEERFAERAKILNHWAVMVNKRLKTDNDGDLDDDDGGGDGEGSSGRKKGGAGKGGSGGSAGKSLKISDMDEWVDSDEEDDDDGDSDGENKSGKKRGKKDDEEDDDAGSKAKSRDAKKKGAAGGKKSNKKNKNLDEEAFEDSDDGDDEGREMDYTTDESSEDEDEINEQISQKGVDQDEGQHF